jgi:hypothetical protein
MYWRRSEEAEASRSVVVLAWEVKDELDDVDWVEDSGVGWVSHSVTEIEIGWYIPEVETEGWEEAGGQSELQLQ